jgi:hypothetical protein
MDIQAGGSLVKDRKRRSSGRALPRQNVLTGALGVAAVVLAPRVSVAAEYHYVDWLTGDAAAGTASGTITLPDDSVVEVNFEALNLDGTAGNLVGVQTEGGIDYWSPDAPYISEEVENPPPTPDLLQLQGGVNQIYRVTLSEAIKDPIMALVSLGQPSVTITYNFDVPFTIVSQGAGYWGGSDTALAGQPNNVLEGSEGHGTIRFLGTFDQFSWTVPTPEYWHGFTFGIRTTERIEPSDAGAPNAGSADAGSADAGSADAGSALLDAGNALLDAASGDSGATPTGDSGPGLVITPREDDGSAPTSGTDGAVTDVVPDAATPADTADDTPTTRRDSGADDEEDAGSTVSCSCRIGNESDPRAASLSSALSSALLGLLIVARRRRRTRV